jgi:hypothetical protein
MNQHCTNCMSERFADLDTSDDPDLQGYSACCNDRVCDGMEYEVQVIVSGPMRGQEIQDWTLTTDKCSRVRACCILRARELLGIR